MRHLLIRRMLMASGLLVGSLAVNLVIAPSASACSVMAPADTMQFEAVARKRVVVSNSPESALTRWTFLVKKWDGGTGTATRLKVGSTITLDVLERRATTGPVTSCFDMGVEATYVKGRRYKITAARYPNQKWTVNNYVGSLTRA